MPIRESVVLPYTNRHVINFSIHSLCTTCKDVATDADQSYGGFSTILRNVRDGVVWPYDVLAGTGILFPRLLPLSRRWLGSLAF